MKCQFYASSAKKCKADATHAVEVMGMKGKHVCTRHGAYYTKLLIDAGIKNVALVPIK